MPALARQQTPQVAQGGTEAPTTTALTAPQGRGNEFAQEQLKQQGMSAGKLTWQAALGESLGGKLYDALSSQLTDDKLVAQANKAVSKATSALGAKLKGVAQPTEQEAAAMFVVELDKALRGLAQEAVTGSGLADGIRGTVDANPYEIALAALAGAVAYVLSNQDLPLFESKLKLGGGHSLVGGIDPGRTMDLTIEQIRLGYRYQGDRVAAHLTADKFKDGVGGSAGIRYSPKADTQMGLEGSYSDRAGQQRTRLDLSYVDPDIAAKGWWEQSKGGDKSGQAIGASVATRGQPGELQRHLSGTYRSDGSYEAAAGIGQTKKDQSWSVEAFGGRTADGKEDVGVRALYKLRF